MKGAEQAWLEDEAINEWLGVDGARADLGTGSSTAEAYESGDSCDVVAEGGLEL